MNLPAHINLVSSPVMNLPAHDPVKYSLGPSPHLHTSTRSHESIINMNLPAHINLMSSPVMNLPAHDPVKYSLGPSPHLHTSTRNYKKHIALLLFPAQTV